MGKLAQDANSSVAAVAFELFIDSIGVSQEKAPFSVSDPLRLPQGSPSEEHLGQILEYLRRPGQSRLATSVPLFRCLQNAVERNIADK